MRWLVNWAVFSHDWLVALSHCNLQVLPYSLSVFLFLHASRTSYEDDVPVYIHAQHSGLAQPFFGQTRLSSGPCPDSRRYQFLISSAPKIPSRTFSLATRTTRTQERLDTVRARAEPRRHLRNVHLRLSRHSRQVQGHTPARARTRGRRNDRRCVFLGPYPLPPSHPLCM